MKTFKKIIGGQDSSMIRFSRSFGWKQTGEASRGDTLTHRLPPCALRCSCSRSARRSPTPRSGSTSRAWRPRTTPGYAAPPVPPAPDQHFHFHGSPTFSRFSSHAFDPIRAPPPHPTLTPNPPIDHQDDLINFKVNSIRSDKALPMEYYKLPYCQPDHIVSSAENLGEVLRGDRIFNSLYQIQMRLDERCKVVCRVVALTPPQVKQIHEAIEYEYR